MTISKMVLGVFTAGVITLGFASAALADTNPIQERQACMKANGHMVKTAVPVLKGQKPYDKATIDKAISAAETACAGWANWWGEDTKPGGKIKTEAKMEIWTDKAGFDAAAANYVKAFAAVKASTDAASLKASFPALGQACQGCHEKFRQNED